MLVFTRKKNFHENLMERYSWLGRKHALADEHIIGISTKCMSKIKSVFHEIIWKSKHNNLFFCFHLTLLTYFCNLFIFQFLGLCALIFILLEVFNLVPVPNFQKFLELLVLNKKHVSLQFKSFIWSPSLFRYPIIQSLAHFKQNTKKNFRPLVKFLLRFWKMKSLFQLHWKAVKFTKNFMEIIQS
jgi:hypothetical protein